MRVGYVGTLGKDSFQTIDGNPRLEFCGSSTTCPTVGFRQILDLLRDPLRANEAESWYHSLQTGLDKRFSGGLERRPALHLEQIPSTLASEIFNPFER